MKNEMKSKMGFLSAILLSGILFSACTTKNATIDIKTETTQNKIQDQTSRSPSGTPEKGNIKQIDYATAATTLGVSEEALKTALGIDETITETEISGTPAQPKKIDFAAAAKTLGVSEEALKAAIGFKDMETAPQGEKPNGAPPEKVSGN